MKESPELRLAIEKRWEKVLSDQASFELRLKLESKDGQRQQQPNLACGTRASTDWLDSPLTLRVDHNYRLAFTSISDDDGG